MLCEYRASFTDNAITVLQFFFGTNAGHFETPPSRASYVEYALGQGRDAPFLWSDYNDDEPEKASTYRAFQHHKTSIIFFDSHKAYSNPI